MYIIQWRYSACFEPLCSLVSLSVCEKFCNQSPPKSYTISYQKFKRFCNKFFSKYTKYIATIPRRRQLILNRKAHLINEGQF